MPSVSEELDLASKVPKKATTYEELNEIMSLLMMTLLHIPKKLTKVKQALSHSLKIYLIINKT